MTSRCLALLLCAGLASASSPAAAFVFPDQKLLVAPTAVTVDRKTLDTARSHALVGFGFEYSLFLVERLALFGQFEMNLDTASQSVVLLGGGSGLTWYIRGGANKKYTDAFIRTQAKSTLNLFSSLGLAARQFDFKPVDKEENSSGQVIKRDRKDVSDGNFFALMVALGAEYPLSYGLVPGLRFQYVKGFSGETIPDVTVTEIWLSVGFLL